jgi:hypothetical protein
MLTEFRTPLGKIENVRRRPHSHAAFFRLTHAQVTDLEQRLAQYRVREVLTNPYSNHVDLVVMAGTTLQQAKEAARHAQALLPPSASLSVWTLSGPENVLAEWRTGDAPTRHRPIYDPRLTARLRTAGFDEVVARVHRPGVGAGPAHQSHGAGAEVVVPPGFRRSEAQKLITAVLNDPTLKRDLRGVAVRYVTVRRNEILVKEEPPRRHQRAQRDGSEFKRVFP